MSSISESFEAAVKFLKGSLVFWFLYSILFHLLIFFGFNPNILSTSTSSYNALFLLSLLCLDGLGGIGNDGDNGSFICDVFCITFKLSVASESGAGDCFEEFSSVCVTRDDFPGFKTSTISSSSISSCVLSTSLSDDSCNGSGLPSDETLNTSLNSVKNNPNKGAGIP